MLLSIQTNNKSLTEQKDDALMNHLLAALPADEFARIEPDLESVSLTLGKVLYESGDKMTHIYFPTTAIISLLYIRNRLPWAASSRMSCCAIRSL